MAVTPTVSVFNANSLPVQVNVNNAVAAFTIGGASGPNWAPQSPTSGGPTWSNTTPAPGVLAPGTNYLNITPRSSTQPVNFTINLPKNFQWSSVQIYIFFDTHTNVSWIALNEGQYVAGNIG